MAAEIAAQIADLEKKLQRLELNSLFSDPRDQKDVILSIHPGAGGTESCDWADMLYRMFLRFCEQREFRHRGTRLPAGRRGAGIKSATICHQGPLCLWHAEVRERRSPPGAHIAV
jgi:peptide chain release factor 2